MREIKEKTFDSACYGSNIKPYYWHSKENAGFPDERACVPKIILGHKPDIDEVLHFMDKDCNCKENNTATVTCYIKKGDKYFKNFHKPGKCPFLEYGGPNDRTK